jgi:rhomboid family GlyGly-CTERM serine protease
MVRSRLGWLFPATLAFVALLAETGGEPLRLVLRYDRAGLADGELWRLISGHLVHLGWSHLWLNLAGLLLVWILVGGVFSILQWCLIAIAAIAAMDAGFWFLKPELGWYVGMSGLLHGLFVAGIAGALINLPGMRREAAFLLLLVAGKLAYEAWSGSLPGSASVAGGNVVTEAHLYGAVGGLAAGVLAALVARAGGRIRLPPAASL